MNQEANDGVIRSGSPLEERWRSLMGLSGKIRAFGHDGFDEISIIRTDDQQEGIMKAWAIPAIPFMDSSSLNLLVDLWPPLRDKTDSGLNFDQAIYELTRSSDPREQELAGQAKDVLDTWVDMSLTRPAKLHASLEKARVEANMADRRLAEIFAGEKLPEDPEEKVVVLVERLELALALQIPFYNIEALVGDAFGFEWNPIARAQKEHAYLSADGGKLDLCALLLPSALKSAVIASELSWNGLDWDKVREITQDLLSRDPEKQILIDIARRANTSPENIVSAANYLEWVPDKVGGKKDDESQDEALEQLSAILEVAAKPPNHSLGEVIRVGQTVNALIRFMNWLPLIKSDTNFTDGTNWDYASVCDASNLLVKILKDNPELWREDFREEFIEQILPQLEHLDATSPKGRLMLKLILDEDRFNDYSKIVRGPSQRKDEYLKQLKEKKDAESVLPLGVSLKPAFLIGGKAFGLEEAINNIPVELNVPEGVVITAESLEEFLMGDVGLWGKILRLNLSADLDEKLVLANEIVASLRSKKLPGDLADQVTGYLTDKKYVVRSSSYDEDLDGLQTGAGVYESVVGVFKEDVPDATLECLSSFFSENAVRYRHLSGGSDIPRFAVIVQDLIEGIGGVAFSRDIHQIYNGIIVECSNNTTDVTSGMSTFARYQISDGGEVLNIFGEDTIETSSLLELARVIELVKDFKNREIDVEWVVDKQGVLWILQVRALPTENSRSESKVATRSDVIYADEGFDRLREILGSHDEVTSLSLLGNRNLDAFQGELLTLIAKHGKRISDITLDQEVGLTSHFANICGTLGIRINRREISLGQQTSS